MALLIGSLPIDTEAAGLGRLTVDSALGQPFRAEVEVTSLRPGEFETLAARLASAQILRQAGRQITPAMAGLHVGIERRPGGRAVVRIATTQAVDDPSVDLVLELRSNAGRDVRAYAFQLDPAGQEAGALRVEGQRIGTGRSAVLSSTDAMAPAAEAESAQAGRSVMVQPGDTLTSIAERVRPTEVAVEQAIVAIYRANPQAFFGTVHQMRADSSLAIPDRDAMASVDRAAARRQIRLEAADFNAYRARLAENARRLQSAQSTATASGAITARIEEASRPESAGDQLKLSRSSPSSTAGAAAAGATGSSAADEALVAAEAALREQRERVSALEKNVADLQRLLELKNKQLAQLQQHSESGRTATTPGASPTASASTTSDPSQVSNQAASGAAADRSTGSTSASDGSARAPTADTNAAEAADTPPADPAASTTAADASADEDVVVGDGSTDPQSSSAATSAEGSEEPTTIASASQPVAAEPPVPAPSPLPAEASGSQSGSMFAPVLALVLVALGAFGWYTMRRRREAEAGAVGVLGSDRSLRDGRTPERARSETTDSADAAQAMQSLPTETGTDHVGGVAAAAAAGALAGSVTGLATANERDTDPFAARPDSPEADPMTEAEVYIAYGREAQAEDILREGLLREPDRHAIRVKLAELVARRDDVEGVAELAREVKAQTGGRGADWAAMAAIGATLDPADPLYAFELELDGLDAGSGKTSSDNVESATGADALDPASDALASPEAAAREVLQSAREARAEAHASPTADQPSAVDEREPPLDFALDVEAPAGRSDEALEFSGDASDRSDDFLGKPPPVRAGGGSTLEDAVGGRFELPTLDFGEPFDPGKESPALEGQPPAPERQPPAPGGESPALSETLDNPESESAIAAPAEVSAQWQEMATKLDLASAYEEIGDKDGARELLEEVVRDGDGDQKRKAQAMLANIG